MFSKIVSGWDYILYRSTCGSWMFKCSAKDCNIHFFHAIRGCVGRPDGYNMMQLSVCRIYGTSGLSRYRAQRVNAGGAI